MLSRVALRAGSELRPALCGLAHQKDNIRVRSAAGQSGERDLVNFPDFKRPIYSNPTRHGFIPEHVFEFFYKKTGVSGPYVFGATVGTYLLSKEWFIIDHEFYGGGPLILLILIVHNKFGTQIGALLDKKIDELEVSVEKGRNDEINYLQEHINEMKDSQWRAEGVTLLFDAKKEAVAVQLEAAYRERLFTAYKQVKSKLDYQVEVLNVQRRIAHKNMSTWILSQVLKSITPQQEQNSLKKCISDLKSLAAARA